MFYLSTSRSIGRLTAELGIEVDKSYRVVGLNSILLKKKLCVYSTNYITFPCQTRPHRCPPSPARARRPRRRRFLERTLCPFHLRTAPCVPPLQSSRLPRREPIPNAMPQADPQSEPISNATPLEPIPYAVPQADLQREPIPNATPLADPLRRAASGSPKRADA